MDAEVLELLTLLASDDEELSDCSSAPDSVFSGVYFFLFMFYVFMFLFIYLFIYFYTRITEIVFMYLFIYFSINIALKSKMLSF